MKGPSVAESKGGSETHRGSGAAPRGFEESPAGHPAGIPMDESPSMAAFSVDVEDYFQVESLRPICPRSSWETFEDRTERNTELVLTILEDMGARGTFYLLGWTAVRHTALVRRITAAGHEIASHGFDHDLVYHQGPDRFRQDVRRARRCLQDLSGQPVLGYRAPAYTIMNRTWWALSILADEGYRYDSSIYPIARRRYGMPRAHRWPQRLSLDGGAAMVEFPLPTARLGKVNLPVTGGAYLRLLPFSYQVWCVRRLVNAKRPFVLSIHPWELDPKQPRMPVNARTRLTHYHNLESTEKRLRFLLGLAAYRSQATVLSQLNLL